MRTNAEDLRLLNFDTAELPTSMSWLRRHISGEQGGLFLLYYVSFPDLRRRVSQRQFCQLFVDHTGMASNINTLSGLAKKVESLLRTLAEAEANKDLAAVATLKFGR